MRKDIHIYFCLFVLLCFELFYESLGFDVHKVRETEKGQHKLIDHQDSSETEPYYSTTRSDTAENGKKNSDSVFEGFGPKTP